ncbi:hypothetical protein Tco_0532994 [Tanacetum coccineum]
MHNNIMAAGSKDRPPMLGPGRYSQWRSHFLRYIDTKPNANAEMWISPLKRLLQGESLNVQELKSICSGDLGKFTSRVGESMESVLLTVYSEETLILNKLKRDKDMQKNLALLAKYFKKLYKPTNNNLQTSSNSKNKTEDTTPSAQKGINVALLHGIGALCKECSKPKEVKDYTYHKEKMMMCKQAEQVDQYATECENERVALVEFHRGVYLLHHRGLSSISIDDELLEQYYSYGLSLGLSSFKKSRGWLDEDLDNYHLKELRCSTQCHTQMSMWIISIGVVLLILLMLGIGTDVDLSHAPKRIFNQAPDDKKQWVACSFMLCDLDFEPSSLSLSSMPSCDLEYLTNILILCLILKASNQSLRKSLSLNLELSWIVCLCRMSMEYVVNESTSPYDNSVHAKQIFPDWEEDHDSCK